MRPDFKIDYGQAAWDKTLRQHYGDDQLEAVYRAIHEPSNSLQQMFKDLLDKTTLDGAQGATLDLVASKVGVSRAVPKAVFLPFFGYRQQPSGRGYGIARYRNIGEGFSDAYLLPDDQLRAFIRAKIIINNSHGLLEDLIEFSKAIFRVEKVKVERTGVRQVLITVGKVVEEFDPVNDYFKSFVPVAAGITATFEFRELP